VTGGIYRDAWGIPHLRADSADAVAYLQGRTAAQDRGWQIEVARLRSEGRLAEHIGAAEVGWDRFARRVRLDDTARRCFAALDAETQRWVMSYVDGVNTALPGSDAPEFTSTGTRPGRWQPWSPLGVFLAQHVLFATFPTKLWRAHVAATIGATGLFDIAPESSGSNAWAVAGSYIAGDPHRIIELPGVYQQVRLSCPEFDVAGMAFPGVPGVPHFGHAGDVAWAVTNAMADYQDVYREELRWDGGQVLVRNADGFAPADVHVETILVRDGDPVEVEVIETPRGPVIDDGLSLRVPSRVEAQIGFAALLPMLRAKSVDDVVAALEHWVEPVNSYVVADRSGALVGLVAGRVPLRDHRNRHLPVPGWDPAHDWHGYAPLPRAARTSLVNANDRRDGDTAAFGVDFAPPHRARRIAELLADGTPPEGVHMDALAAPAPRDLIAQLAPASAAGRAVRDRLAAWDGRMDAASEDAGAFAAWRTALVTRLTAHPDLAPLCSPTGFDALFAPWTDPITRIGLALDRLAPRYPDLAAAALDDVAAGEPPGTWGSRHRLIPVRLAGATTLPPAPELSGDSNCVLATSSIPGVSDICWRGPVTRYVWDLTDRARSRWIVPFGASGDPRDRHFADQLPLWVRGELVPVTTDWTELVAQEDDEPPAVGRTGLRR
jgi:penicillin amidase